MKDLIKFCYENQKVVSLYLDKDETCSHLTGYIYNYNDSEILVAHMNPRGEYDGFVFEYVCNIYRIDYDGEYEDKIKTLYKLKKQSHPQIENFESGILPTLLNFAKNNKLLISIEMDDNSVIGFVDRFDNNRIRIETVNDYGSYSGITVMSLGEIETLVVDTDFEQDLKLLTKLKTQGTVL